MKLVRDISLDSLVQFVPWKKLLPFYVFICLPNGVLQQTISSWDRIPNSIQTFFGCCFCCFLHFGLLVQDVGHQSINTDASYFCSAGLPLVSVPHLHLHPSLPPPSLSVTGWLWREWLLSPSKLASRADGVWYNDIVKFSPSVWLWWCEAKLRQDWELNAAARAAWDSLVLLEAYLALVYNRSEFDPPSWHCPTDVVSD